MPLLSLDMRNAIATPALTPDADAGAAAGVGAVDDLAWLAAENLVWLDPLLVAAVEGCTAAGGAAVAAGDAGAAGDGDSSTLVAPGFWDAGSGTLGELAAAGDANGLAWEVSSEMA